jgi:hypothetical protein
MARVGPDADLAAQIRQKRHEVERFISRALPRKRRLLNVTLVGGALSAVLTTGPAVGGQSFTAWLTKTFSLTSPTWQILCAATAVCSVLSTVATQLLKSHNLEERVIRAQGCRAKLEALEVGLSTGQMDVPRAASEYLKCIEETAFLSP